MLSVASHNTRPIYAKEIIVMPYWGQKYFLEDKSTMYIGVTLY